MGRDHDGNANNRALTSNITFMSGDEMSGDEIGDGKIKALGPPPPSVR